jgi:hypothetical protein
MRHKWRGTNSRSWVCRQCNMKRVFRKRETRDSYTLDEYFIYPDGTEVFIKKGAKIPPCDGRLLK